MILKLGIAVVALVDGMLLMNGTLSLITFFMFLLVVSRIYEPFTGTLQNLAAMNSLQVNIDRINESTKTVLCYRAANGREYLLPAPC